MVDTDVAETTNVCIGGWQFKGGKTNTKSFCSERRIPEFGGPDVARRKVELAETEGSTSRYWLLPTNGGGR